MAGHITGRCDQTLKPRPTVEKEVAKWFACRRHVPAEYTPTTLADREGDTTIAVIIPTKNCAATIAGILQQTASPLRDVGLVDKLLVVDADSPDGIAERAAAAGATVVRTHPRHAGTSPSGVRAVGSEAGYSAAQGRYRDQSAS